MKIRISELAAFVVGASALNGFLFIVGNPLRLAFIAETFRPFLVIGSALGALCFAACVLWVRDIKISGIEALLLGYLIVLLIFADWGHTPAALILLDFAKPVLFLAIVAVLRAGLHDVSALSRATLYIGWTSILLSVIFMAVCWTMRAAGYPMYPAYMTLDASLGAGVLWGSMVGMPAYAFAVLLSAKRGLYVAFAVLLGIWALRRWGVRAPGMIVVAGGVAAVAGFALMGTVSDAGPGDFISSFATKSEGPAATLDESLLRAVLGGRVEEFEGAFRGVHSPMQLLVGRGLGFSYVLEGSELASDTYRNLHFTPAALLIYYGVVFIALLAIYLAPIAIRAIAALLTSRNVVELTFAAYFVACLVYSLTEYSVFAYSNFAVATGVLLAIQRQRNLSAEQSPYAGVGHASLPHLNPPPEVP